MVIPDPSSHLCDNHSFHILVSFWTFHGAMRLISSSLSGSFVSLKTRGLACNLTIVFVPLQTPLLFTVFSDVSSNAYSDDGNKWQYYSLPSSRTVLTRTAVMGLGDCKAVSCLYGSSLDPCHESFRMYIEF